MPWNIPGGSAAFGFMPYNAARGELAQVNMYTVSSSEGQIFPGDVVTLSSIQGNQIPMVRLLASAGGTLPMVGIAAAGLAAAGGSSGNLTINTSQLIPVYDSPDQLFFANDTTSGLIGSTSLGKNVQFSATAAGSTAANRSGMFLAGATASSNAAFPFKVLAIHPLEGVAGYLSTSAPGTGVSTDVRKFIVQPLNHTYAQAGLILLTT